MYIYQQTAMGLAVKDEVNDVVEKDEKRVYTGLMQSGMYFVSQINYAKRA